MFKPAHLSGASLADRLRDGMGRRAVAIGVTLLLEAILILMLITLGMSKDPEKTIVPLISTFDVGNEPESEAQTKPDIPKAEKQPEATPKPAPSAAAAPEVPQNTPPTSLQPQAMPSQPALIPMSRNQMATLDIGNLPKSAPSPAAAATGKPAPYGPVDTGYPGDSKRVGRAPNGEPLYAAAWYREPYDSELSGYLSTASGPGWGIIVCRTVPEFRVENCEVVEEYPAGSRIARAVLAAAWQFQVRPPRVGGRSKYGEWVRIRIVYGPNRVRAE